MCLIDDAEPVTMLAERQPIARIQHRCDECKRTIEPGERYRSESMIHDGAFRSHKTCAHCEVARLWLNRECGGWVFGAVLEDIIEHAGDYKRIDIYRIAAGMRRRWRDRHGALVPTPSRPLTSIERSQAA